MTRKIWLSLDPFLTKAVRGVGALIWVCVVFAGIGQCSGTSYVLLVFLSMFGSWSALTLTLNQRVREFESPAANESLFTAGVERTLGRTGSLTLPQLCQNYMALSVQNR